MSTLGDQALALVERGFAVFPLQPGDKNPLGGHGFLDATRDEDHVRYWWRKTPDANIGVATGPRSGVWVLDVDTKHGLPGNEFIEQSERDGRSLYSGLMVRTATGGLHLYYRWPEGRVVRNSTSRVAKAVDVRGDGGYVVAAGSVRPGGVYVAELDGEPWDAEGWLLDLAAPNNMPAPKPAPPVLDVRGEADRARAFLERLAGWRVDDYDAWVRVGMALAGLGAEGLALWEWWSSRSSKYKQGECARKWKSFDTAGVSLASLAYWADQDSPRHARGKVDYARIIAHGL